VPTYVFTCESCRHEFSVETPWSKKSEVRCPKCEGAALKEMFGRYTLSVVGADGQSAADPSCGCGSAGGG